MTPEQTKAQTKLNEFVIDLLITLTEQAGFTSKKLSFDETANTLMDMATQNISDQATELLLDANKKLDPSWERSPRPDAAEAEKTALRIMAIIEGRDID